MFFVILLYMRIGVYFNYLLGKVTWFSPLSHASVHICMYISIGYAYYVTYVTVIFYWTSLSHNDSGDQNLDEWIFGYWSSDHLHFDFANRYRLKKFHSKQFKKEKESYHHRGIDSGYEDGRELKLGRIEYVLRISSFLKNNRFLFLSFTILLLVMRFEIEYYLWFWWKNEDQWKR